MSSVFYAFLVEHGIKYYHIVPYTLEQNEVVVVQHMYLIGVPLKHCTLSLHMRFGMAERHLLLICVFSVVWHMH